MVSAPLAVDAALSLATGLAYAYVGALMLRRTLERSETRLPMRMFALWWFGLATYALLTCLGSGLGAVGMLDVRAHAAIRYGILAPIVGSVCGLLAYLLYIYTGRRNLIPAVAALHGLILIGFAALVTWRRPVAVETDAWSVTLVFARAAPPGVRELAVASILVPVLVSAVLYGTLFFRARDRTARFRIAVVSTAFCFWFGSAAAAHVAGWTNHPRWPLAIKLTGLAATMLVLVAYRPPRIVQERLGVVAVCSGSADAPARAAAPNATEPQMLVSDGVGCVLQAEPPTAASETSTTVLESPRSREE